MDSGDRVLVIMAVNESEKNFRSLKFYWFQRDTKEIKDWKVGDRTQPFHIHRRSIGFAVRSGGKQQWA